MSYTKKDIQKAYIDLYSSKDVSVQDCIELANDAFIKMNTNQAKYIKNVSN
jgi:hypothetical protein